MTGRCTPRSRSATSTTLRTRSSVCRSPAGSRYELFRARALVEILPSRHSSTTSKATTAVRGSELQLHEGRSAMERLSRRGSGFRDTIPTKFYGSGDPVAGTGYLDPIRPNRRFMLISARFNGRATQTTSARSSSRRVAIGVPITGSSSSTSRRKRVRHRLRSAAPPPQPRVS